MDQSQQPPQEPHAAGFALPEAWARTLESVKARAYLASTLLGFPSITAAWAVKGLHGTLSAFDRFAYPALALLCLWIFWTLYTRRLPIAWGEQLVFSGISLLYAGQLTQALFSPAGWQGWWKAAASEAYPTLVVLSVVSFLINPARRALAVNLGLYGLTAGLTAARLAAEPGTASDVDLVAIVRWLLGHGSIVALMYALSWTKEHYLQARVAADLMARLARTDYLTGLLNRMGAYLALSGEVDQARRHRHPLSVVLIDLDGFKQVNDTLGHDAGDALLREVAHLLTRHVRAVDKVARWGGDEFLVVCPHADEKRAQALAQRLQEALQARGFGRLGSVSASFGVAAWQPGDSPDALVRRADGSLYRVKLGRPGSARLAAAAGAGQAATPAAAPAVVARHP